MQTSLISSNLIPNLAPFFSSHPPLILRRNQILLEFHARKWPSALTTTSFCASPAGGSMSCGGWDDLRFGNGLAEPGESNQLLDILNSLGIGDKKYLLMYALGFLCALAVTRVKVSSIVVFPACVVVFAIGFSIGFVNRGHTNQLSFSGNKRRAKEEINKGSIEKLRTLVDIFNGFDIKIDHLKNDVRRGIENNRVTVADLEGYFSGMDSVRLSVLSARDVVEDCVGPVFVENQEVNKPKSSMRRKEIDRNGFNWSLFLVGLFEKNSADSKLSKMKGLAEKEARGVPMNDSIRECILVPPAEEKVSEGSISNIDEGIGKMGFSGNNSYSPVFLQDEAGEPVNRPRRNGVVSKNKNFSLLDNDNHSERILSGKAKNYSDQRNDQRVSLNVEYHDELEAWEYLESLLDSDDSCVGPKHLKTEASFRHEHTSKSFQGNYMRVDTVEESENYSSEHNRREYRVNFDDHQRSSVSDDIVFDKCLMEARSLLRYARECLCQRGEKKRAENALYNCAKLLSKAIDMKPMSLLAVGQLGNTYLLHGELKLKISRELRTSLARSPSSPERHQVVKGLDDQDLSRDNLASALFNVCEECEELLVKAGRKYRLALSIDGNDMKALYNWGLALSFRAQLIADIGPEAAVDADKVFLAAIDKFDAMMSRSNTYAPNALFRWALILQQRSRLRSRSGREKVKLLEQAKRLYEDALHMDSSNTQVKEALSSCISELNYRRH